MDDLEQTEKEHRGIAVALKRRDAVRGVELLREHFHRGEKVVLGNPR